MLSLFKRNARYLQLGDDDDADQEAKLDPGEVYVDRSVTVRVGLCSFLALFLLLGASVASWWILLFHGPLKTAPVDIVVQQPSVAASAPSRSTWLCQQQATRREWRTLSDGGRLQYVDAVRCLATRPSKLRNNGTLYDDFPWVHKHTAGNSEYHALNCSRVVSESRSAHASAPFLPWHRYYIHLYEKALQEECSFNGNLP